MEDNIKEIIGKMDGIINEIERYIENTDNNLFYWIINNDVRAFIEEYPNDYKDMYQLRVLSVGNSSALVKISFDEHPNGVREMDRYCILPNFRNNANAEYERFNGNLIQLRRKELEDNLKYHEERIKLIKEEIQKVEHTMKRE